MDNEGQPTEGRMLIAEPLDHALERTRHLLFSPFNLTKWVCFGVIVFLDVLIKGSFLSVFNIWSYDIPGILNDAEEKFGDIRRTIESNATVIVGVLIVALFAYLIFVVLTTWLSSRGQLMFVRAVSLDDHAINRNWAGVHELSGSLFWFRLGVKFAILAMHAATVTIAAILVTRSDVGGLAEVLTFLLVLYPLWIVWLTGVATLWTVSTVLRDFIVPIMFHYDLTCLVAWRKFGGIVRGNIWPLHLFYLVRFGISVVMGFAGTLVGCFTCFLGLIPVIHHSFLAPLYVFDRVFSLYALQSAGMDIHLTKPTGPDTIDPFGERGPRDLAG